MDAGLALLLGLLISALLAALVWQSVRARRLGRRVLNLERASYRDDLTGLTNRRIFQEILALEIAQAKRTDQFVGLAVIDVDDLKLVNDGLGFEAGDQVLISLARRLRRLTREADTVARLGGDQFALLFARCDELADVFSAVYRLRESWKAPLIVGGQELDVSCSVGLSVFPHDAPSSAELLEHAGTAVVQAQERGCNQLAVFDPTSNRLAHDRLLRGQELKRALEGDQFELFLQPQVSLPDGRLIGAEGLVRWRHPSAGLLSAARFIPLAEQMGMMPEVSSWILEEICRCNAAWQQAGLPIVPISVNVSARHFQSEDVPGVIGRILRAHGLEPRFLELEVTESAALHDVELMTRHFTRLRELGVRLHLDDFGTGYSSLSYLMRYPLNVLKIDRSFVAGLHEKEESRAIVKATLAMAASLGLDVIAEGIESEAELDCLVGLGCRNAQGFLLSRPMPCEDFERVLAAGRVAVPDIAAA